MRCTWKGKRPVTGPDEGDTAREGEIVRVYLRLRKQRDHGEEFAYGPARSKQRKKEGSFLQREPQGREWGAH